MRSAKNLHLKWGYVPTRTIDFMRVISIFLVATTIGATTGGGVVLSLVDVPTGQASVAAAHIGGTRPSSVPPPPPPPPPPPISASEPAPPHPQPIVEFTMGSRGDDRVGTAVNVFITNPKIVEPAGIAPLTEVGPNDASVKVSTPPSAAAVPPENKTTKNRHVARHAERTVERGGYGAWGWGGSVFTVH